MIILVEISLVVIYATFRCRVSNTLIIRYEHNAGTGLEPLLETVVLLLQITDSQRYMQ